MQFTITGQVREKETGKPFPGLIIQVRDTESWFDGCLGAATTGQDGGFSFVYPEQDFREVFEKRPEVYLTVSVPPLKPILDTRQKVRWGASASAHFAIAVSRKLVNRFPPRPENQVQGGVDLSSRQLTIARVNGLHLPTLPGFGNGARYGSPSILEQMQVVMLPAGASVEHVEIVPGPVLRKGRNINPFPVQRPRIDLPGDDPAGGDLDGSKLEPNAHIHQFVPPDPHSYQGKKPYPEQLVVLGYSEEHEGVQLIQVRVRPLQYDPVAHQYLFYPKLQYIVHYKPALVQAKPVRRAANQAAMPQRSASQQFMELLERADVHVYPGAFSDRFTQPGYLEIPTIPLVQKVNYLIITDDFEWSETRPVGGKALPTGQENYVYSGPPTGPGAVIAPAPDGSTMVDHFRRLAKWKTQRGLRTKVVTVSEIVENKDQIYGDLAHRREVHALDLQEVIRNFIWWTHENWSVDYLLLGGDTNIIPMRKLVAYITDRGNASGWDCMRQDDDLLAKDQCKYYAAQKITKIHYCGKSPIVELPLLTHQGGTQIRYYDFKNVPDTHFPRWFCVNVDSAEDFQNIQAPFTPWEPPSNPNKDKRDYYVVVEDNGNHLAQINDDYYWVSEGRWIPTDRYYACAGSQAGMEADERDFDKIGNHLPGQFRWDEIVENEVPIDGFKITPDVYLGRAPVRTPAEAEAFVDKVIAYERLEQAGTAPTMNSDFLKHVIHIANYASLVKYEIDSGTNANPSSGTFIFDASKECAKIQIAAGTDVDGKLFDDGQLKYRLILVDADQDTEIPRAPDGSSGRYWCFMHDSSFQSSSASETRFIKVNLPGQTNVSQFFWDPVGFTDYMHTHQENLRNYMLGWYPEFNQVMRVYRDHFEPGAPAIIPLNWAYLKGELDAGCHFLTAHAHGNPNGIAGLRANNFLNPNPSQSGTYIACVQSCETACPDYDANNVKHSLGEAIVVQKGGGAVAYVGSARMDGSYEKTDWFWDNLRITRRLGPTSAACKYPDGVDQLYYTYNRTLYGDPEMPVWVKMPKNYLVFWPESAARGEEVEIKVHYLKALDNKLPGSSGVTPRSLQSDQLIPLKDQLVTLVAGWEPLGTDPDRKKRPELFRSAKTDSHGRVRFKIPETLQAGMIEITVCACGYAQVADRYDYKPATHTLAITP